MKSLINIAYKLYAKLPQPENWKVWIGVAFLVKALFVTYYISMSYSYGPDYAGYNYKGSWAKAGGDTPSYFEPIENLIENNVYFDDYRMPGYGWLYFLLRILFSSKISFNIILVIQLILSAICVYYLSKISYYIFKKGKVFFITFSLYAVSTFVSINDFVLMTESLTVSTIIISIYLLLLFFEKSGYKYLFLSGLFITWAIFLRPIVAPILFIYICFLIIKLLKLKIIFSKILISIFVLIVPLIIFDGLWIMRNYKNYKRIIPLQRALDYDNFIDGYGLSARKFVRSFGGNDEWWEITSEASFFIKESEHFDSYEFNTIKKLFPHYIYTSQFNEDSLFNVRKMIIALYDLSPNSNEYDSLNKSIKSKFYTFQYSIKNEKPFLYYVSSNFICLYKMLFISHKNFEYLWHYYTDNPYFKIFKHFYSFYYYFILIGGLLGLFLLFNKNANFNAFLIICMFLYLTMIYPFAFKYQGTRFFATAYPFLFIFINQIFLKLYIKKN